MAPLKLASGCDRRCSFCAIPSFRGSFVSRRPSDVLGEARWLAGEGVRELFLVSENSTSYGKDLGDLRLLETLLPELAAVDGIERVRVSYLQPAETRPGLVEAIATTPGVAPYFDLSFQHASATVLRRMRRFGDPERFLGPARRRSAPSRPRPGVRSNVIVGFPGETEDDLQTLCDFLVAARMDVTGVFGYSDEDGTEAATYDGKLDEDEVRARAEHVTGLVEELTAQRAEERIGEKVEVLVESRRRRRGGRGPGRPPGPGGRRHHAASPGPPARRRRPGPRRRSSAPRASTWSRRGGRGERQPLAARQREQLEPAQRADRRCASCWCRSSAGRCSHDGGDSIAWRLVAFAIFVVAMITDKIDGDIARKHDLVTDFGKIADPIADKAITGMAFIGLSIIGDIWWWVTIVVLVREWSVTLLRLSVLKQVVIAAAGSGKIKTTLQAIALAGLTLPLPHGDAHGGAFDVFGAVGEVLFYVAPGRAGGRRGDDAVVGLRVLPRRLAPAAQHRARAPATDHEFVTESSSSSDRGVPVRRVRVTRASPRSPVLGPPHRRALPHCVLDTLSSTPGAGRRRRRSASSPPRSPSSPSPAQAASTGLIITEVYGGGGNAGADLNADFVELKNLSSVADLARRQVAPVPLRGGTGDRQRRARP